MMLARAGAAAMLGARRHRSLSAFTPEADPLALLWWDPTTVSGAVSSWTDKIAGVAASQATATKQPAQSSTAIGGAYPGVTGDGNDVLEAAGAGAILSGKTTLTLVCAMLDADAGSTTRFCLELTTSYTANDGGFALGTNPAVATAVFGGVRGTVNFTARRVTEGLATVKVVSVGYDYATAGANAIKFIRVNGVAQAMTSIGTSSAAGAAANATLHLFGRGSTPTNAWPGTFGDIVIRNSIAEDATLEAHEDFIAARCGA